MSSPRPRAAAGGFPYFLAPAENDNGTPLAPPANRSPGAPAAGQAAASEGAGVARPVEPAPSTKIACPPPPPPPTGADRWAPRPKLDPLTAPPAIGWQAARQSQRQRKAAARSASSFALVGKLNRRAAEETAAALARQACPFENAALELRRRNRIVYRMTVLESSEQRLVVTPANPETGEPAVLETYDEFSKRLAAHWYCSSLGRHVTGEQLVELAERLAR